MYLCFDIGGTAIKYGYLNKEGEILNQGEFASKNLTTLELFINKLQSVYQSNKDIEGIALSCPGVIDAKKGLIEVIVMFPFLQDVCLTEVLSAACDNLPVTLENDARCAGLAEVWKGNAKDYQDAIIIVLGTGIGATLIKNKQIHYGANKFAGEISTIIVGYDKETKKGIAWSDIASASALCKRVATALNQESITGRAIFTMLDNPMVIQVFNDYCQDIAIQLYNLQYVYDPGIICIGGGISKQPMLLQGIQRALDEIGHATKALLPVHVTNCKFYNQANLIGALYHFLTI